MAYRVEVYPAAQRQMLSLPPEAQTQIAGAIDRLNEEPHPAGIKKLREIGLWRIRVGRYRVVFAIDDGKRTVAVVKVATRRENTYKGL